MPSKQRKMPNNSFICLQANIMSRSKQKPDYVILGLVAGLILFGLIMISSATGPLAYTKFGSTTYFLKHQILYGVLPGIIALFITMRIPYTFWKKSALPLLVISILLLIAVFIPGIRADFGTAHNWIKIGPISFQPSEIVKLTFLFYLASWLERRSENAVRNLHTGLIPFLMLVGVIMGLLLLEPDTGSMAIIVAEAVAVYFVAGASLIHLGVLSLMGVGLLLILIKISPYRAARLMTFIHPELDPRGIGYHVNQALLAVGSGGFWGLGLGHSRQKFEYLPEVQSDSIFAIIAEELGFVFSVGLIALFGLLLWRGLRVVTNTPDHFGKFVGVGILAWILIQAFVNIGAMIGVLPLTGVPLPFISYGGTSLVMNMAAIGVLLNISRNTA